MITQETDEDLETVETLDEADDPDFPTDEEIAAEGDPDSTDDDGRTYEEGPDGEVSEAGHAPSSAVPSDADAGTDEEETAFATDDAL